MRKLIVFLSIILMGSLAAANSPPSYVNHEGFQRHRHWPTSTPTGSPPSNPIGGITYDTSIGLSVDSTGRANLTPRSGATVYYVNSTTGNDTNTCLQAQSPSTPRATIKQGEACVTDGNGDFLLIAQGMAYPNGFASIGDKGGYSAQYPVVYESYDPADPTNQAKWGTASGSLRPDINMSSGTDNSNGFILGNYATSKQYRAFRGLNFDGNNVAGANLNIYSGTGGNAPDFMLFENDQFAATQLSISSNEFIEHTKHVIVRNSSFYGQWSTDGRGQGLFANFLDGLTIEDSAFIHAGWKIGAAKTDPVSSGGFSGQAHPIYSQVGTTNVIVRRNVFVDNSGEAGELKSGGIYQGNLALASPLNGWLGYGNLYSEHAPFGIYGDGSFNAILGGAWCYETMDMMHGSGSSVHHNVCANSDPTMGTAYGLMADDSPDLSAPGSNPNISLPTYPIFDHNVLYSWAASGGDQAIHINSSTGLIGDIHSTYTNNIWGDPTSGSNTNNSGATFPNPYTETSLLAALGEASQSAAESDWEANPQNHGWESGAGLVLAGYGIVDPGLVDLKTNMALTAGYATSGQFIGTRDGSSYPTVTGLPSGVTFDASCKCWRYDGSNTTVSSGTFAITETNGPLSHTTTIPWSISATPVLSGLSVTAANGAVAVNVNSNTASGALFAEITTSSAAADWAHIRGGLDSTDASGLPHTTQTITATGSQPTITFNGLTNGTTYYAQVAQLDANNNPSITSLSSFVPATGTALLSSPIASFTGPTTASLSVSSDTGSGTLYWVVSTSATIPTAAQIELGEDNSGSSAVASGNQAVSATGTQSGSATGLTNGVTYHTYFVQHTTVDSNISTPATFTTGAWTPAALGANLLWWAEPKPANLTKLGGGTPADGDQVSAITDLSGNGHTLTQSTTGHYPIYHTDGTHYWLTFSGGQALTTASGTYATGDASGQHMTYASVSFANTTGTQNVVTDDQEDGGAGRVSQNLRVSSGTSQSIAFNTVPTAFTDSGPTVTSSVGHVLSEETTTTTVEMFVDGTGNGSTAITGTLTTTAGAIGIGGFHNSTQFFNGNWYGGFMYKGIMGATLQSNAQTYMAALHP